MVRDWVKNARSVDEDDDSVMTPPRVAATAAATTGSGFLSGSMGIGGGLLNVPLLVYVLGRKTRKAIGTSSLLIIPTAAVGFVAYVVDLALRPGGFAWPAEFVLIPILMPVVFVGAYAGSRWGLETLRTRSVALSSSSSCSSRPRSSCTISSDHGGKALYVRASARPRLSRRDGMDRTDGSHWFYSYLPQGVAGGATSALIPLFAYALGGTPLPVGIIAPAASPPL